MLAELTFGQELWLAVIQAAAVALGVVGALALGIWQARKAWKNQLDALKLTHEHQAQAERERLLRSERIVLYRRLLQTGYEATMLSGLPASDDASRKRRDEALITWSAAHAETRLIGSERVIAAAGAVSQLLFTRRVEQFQVTVTAAAHQAFPQDQSLTDEEDSSEQEGEVLDRVTRVLEESIESMKEREPLLLALIAACRDDIEPPLGVVADPPPCRAAPGPRVDQAALDGSGDAESRSEKQMGHP